MATGGGTSETAVGAGEENAIPTRRFFVALHVGAGFHAPANEKGYRRAMKRACLAAAAILREVRSLSSYHPLSPSCSLLSWLGRGAWILAADWNCRVRRV